jgi:hypothetical protein
MDQCNNSQLCDSCRVSQELVNEELAPSGVLVRSGQFSTTKTQSPHAKSVNCAACWRVPGFGDPAWSLGSRRTERAAS